jgi:elongation factor G
MDEHFMSLCLEHDYNDIPLLEVVAVIKRACIARLFMPVLFGTALRGKGIQPLLDAVVAFLPSPSEAQQTFAMQHKSAKAIQQVSHDSNELCALAFKVLHDPNRGAMVYARLYGGTINAKQTIFNSTTGMEERVQQILSIQADQLSHINSAGTGSVCCLIGLKHTKTGDTLVASDSKLKQYVLEGLDAPKPVYSIAIEPENESQRPALEQALQWQCLEDPSLHMELEPESGQTIIRGLGELHLEVLRDKLQRQYRLPVYVSQTYIGYRESLIATDIDQIEQHFTYDTIKDNKRMYAKLGFRIHRRDDHHDCRLSISDEVKTILRSDQVQALQEALQNSIRHGSKGYPVVGLDISISSCLKDDVQSTSALRACVALFMQKILQTNHELLEPVMEVEISAPISYMGDIINDLTASRRGELKEVLETGSGMTVVISGLVPLQSLIGYASALRSTTHGEASFSAEYHSHRAVV